jgi:hypothetical protein
MKFDYYTYHLSGHFISALVNGDRTGLEDQDESDLDAWIDSLPVSGHFEIIDEEGNFRECDITGLHSDCFEVRLYFQTEEATQ